MGKKYAPRHTAPKKKTSSQTKTVPERNRQPAPQPEVPTQPKPRRQLQRRRRLRHGLIVALTVLLVAAAVMTVVSLLHRDGLKGTWALDDTTVYEFDGWGHGVLSLPLGSYEFQYFAEEDRLSIDSIDETVFDAGYTFQREGKTLTLDTNTGTVYQLEKQK